VAAGYETVYRETLAGPGARRAVASGGARAA
jgi:hypothetical protein